MESHIQKYAMGPKEIIGMRSHCRPKNSIYALSEDNGHAVGGKVQLILCFWQALIQREASYRMRGQAGERALVQGVVRLKWACHSRVSLGWLNVS